MSGELDCRTLLCSLSCVCKDIQRQNSVIEGDKGDAQCVRAVRICLPCHPSRIQRNTSR